MTREQRDLLRKRIDAQTRERLSAMAPKGPRPTGHVPGRKAKKRESSRRAG